MRENGKFIEGIRQTILAEYPVLNGSQMVVRKRFQAADNSRTYNTYLVESSKEGFERFVAKGSANPKFRQAELDTEWRALRFLSSQPRSYPGLLVPDQKPKEFLLLEYIEGKTAAEIILSDADREETFYQAGRVAGKTHTIEVPSFGRLSSPSDMNWKSYFDAKTEARFPELSGILSDELITKLRGFYASSAHLLEDDAPEFPVLTQRDMNFENFIIREDSGEAVLIDFAYAAGGRPLYDLGTLYVEDFYRYPDLKDKFLHGYQEFISLPDNFNDLMKLYTMSTLLGMVYMANVMGRTQHQERLTGILSDLVEGRGRITELLQP
jgi:aminoglycoside phosphotransferase (APT) family kinase protein